MSDWTQYRLGDLLTLIRNGVTATQTDAITPYPVSRIETISEGCIDRQRVRYLLKDEPRYLLQDGDILYSHINSYLHVGKAALYEDGKPLYHGMNLLVLRPNKELVVPFVLHAVLTSEYGRSHARKECKPAINQVSLGQRNIVRLAISLPCHPEQRKIARILTTVDNLIEKTEVLIAKYQAIKQGMMHDLFTRGVDEHGHLRPPYKEAPELYKHSELGWIPKEWEVVAFDDITPSDAPICYGIVQPGTYCENGVPVVAIYNLRTDFAALHRSSTQIESQYVRSRVRGGDVLLSVKGTTGRVDVVPKWFHGNISRDIARLRPKPGMSAEYLRQMLTSPHFQSLLDNAIVGTTRAELSIGILRRLPLILPSENEQTLIADLLRSADSKVASERSHLDKMKKLTTGLMQDLLTGKVRVNVVGADEVVHV